jgi:hypothetical protein
MTLNLADCKEQIPEYSTLRLKTQFVRTKECDLISLVLVATVTPPVMILVSTKHRFVHETICGLLATPRETGWKETESQEDFIHQRVTDLRENSVKLLF